MKTQLVAMSHGMFTTLRMHAVELSKEVIPEFAEMGMISEYIPPAYQEPPAHCGIKGGAPA